MARILIAEDSPTAVEVLRHALAPLGHEIVVATNGEEAAELALADPPALVIMDVIMPRMNGFQLCRLLRRQAATKEVPIIIVTSMDRESDRYWGLKQGADEYLVKPVDATVLLQKVGECLSTAGKRAPG